MELSATFIGTAASAPSASRGLTSLLVKAGGDALLFDCGEGTQRQLIRSVGLLDLEHIFITHFHADHVLGLPGMLKTFGLRGREMPLRIYGPPGLVELMKDLQPMIGRLSYEFGLTELEDDQSVDFDGYEIVPFAVRHGVTAHGYSLVEQTRPGRFDHDSAIKLGVEFGPDFGRLQNGESVKTTAGATVTPDQVLGPARPGRRFVYTGDTAPCDQTLAAAYKADLLVHEASFLDEDAQRAGETNHSTASQAASIALEAEVKMLCLTHLSSRYPAKLVKEEARAVFPNTEVPRDFDSIEIPFAERGEPTLVRHRSD